MWEKKCEKKRSEEEGEKAHTNIRARRRWKSVFTSLSIHFFTNSRYISAVNKFSFCYTQPIPWHCCRVWGPGKMFLQKSKRKKEKMLTMNIFQQPTQFESFSLLSFSSPAKYLSQLHGRPVWRFECRSGITKRDRLAQRDEEATEPAHQIDVVEREKFTEEDTHTPAAQTRGAAERWLSFHSTFNFEWNNRIKMNSRPHQEWSVWMSTRAERDCHVIWQTKPFERVVEEQEKSGF